MATAENLTEAREHKLESDAEVGEETPSESDGSRRSDTLENKGGTLKDESSSRPRDHDPKPVDALEAALARALDLATTQGRLDLVERILARLEGGRIVGSGTPEG